MSGKEIDSVTGVETTGHVWDGDLKELNKPLPRWWLYVLYATIVWAIGYWIVYPAWPTLNDTYTKGVFDYSQRAELGKEIAAAKEAQANYFAEIAATPARGARNLARPTSPTASGSTAASSLTSRRRSRPAAAA